MKKYNFVYLSENLINGKKYIGVHSTNNLNEARFYIGSGDLFKKAIKKYGKNNFKREILEFCNKEDLGDRECFWINYYKTHVSEGGYNLSLGGEIGKEYTKETRDKISNSLKIKYNESPELREKLRDIKIGLKSSIEARKKMSSSQKKRWEEGKGISNEGIERIKEANRSPKSEEHRNKISQSKKGQKIGEEAKRKISKSLKGRSTSPKSQFKSGENNINSKLSNSDRKIIKLRILNGEYLTKIAKDFDVTPQAIFAIKKQILRN